MLEGIKVRLTTDLTAYHKALVPGIEGVTTGQTGMWSRGSDRFIGVHFPGATMLDVLWDSINIIDEVVLAQIAERKRLRFEARKSAKDVVLTVGPAGGLKSLTFHYTDEAGRKSSESTCIRSGIVELVAFFEAHGIEVSRQQLPRQPISEFDRSRRSRLASSIRPRNQ